MKKNLLISAMVAFLFAILQSGNAAPFDNTVMTVHLKKSTKEKVLELRIGNLQNQTTHISIQDLDGKIGLALDVKNQNTYLKNVDLKFVPKGDYILLIENETSQYIRAFSMSDNDVSLYQKESSQKSVDQYAGTNGGSNGGTGMSKKARMVKGVVRSLENTSSNINFLFVETPERSYFQFFSISDKGVAIENAQNINKVAGKKPENKMAVLSEKPK